MRGTFDKYFKVWAVTLAAMIVAVCVFNLTLDPFGAYRLVAADQLAPYKGQFASRVGKAEMLRHGPPGVVVLGSSRVELGVDPHSAVWGEPNVYNLGLSATNLAETLPVLEYAMRAGPPTRVVLVVDFLMFSEKRTPGEGFDKSRFAPKLNILTYHVENMLGSYATLSSWDVLTGVIRSERTEVDTAGYLNRSAPPKDGHRKAFRKAIRKFLTHPELYNGYVYGRSRLEDFQQIVKLCRERGCELIVIIPPVHALQLETIRQAGLWKDFEKWKRDLVTGLAEDAIRHPDSPAISLWDFTAYTGYNAEPVPADADRSAMQWYWESSHFKKELGDLMLARALGGEGSFGVRLTRENIEQHLETLRNGRATYLQACPDDAAMVREIGADVTSDPPAAGQ